uniref:gamma-glutamylcyclotransferase family protein n=1 Tax=Falsiroseomonas oryzae TaxID=2766473 RepID=UPI0022EB5E15
MPAGAPVFLYGTLLDPRVFARFAGRAPLRCALAAVLPGHRRVTLRGTPYPTLLRGAGEVHGLLLPRLA